MEKIKVKAIMNHIGDITIDGGIVCSDPCYDPKIWCSYRIESGMSGVWGAYSSMYMSPERGYNISSLTIVRDGFEVKEASEKLISGSIGVDSGTCGFFDLEYYDRNHKPGDSEWYDKFVGEDVSDVVFSHCVEGKGIWTQTTFGDGTYGLIADYDGEEIIRLTLLYDCVDSEVLKIVDSEEDIVFPYSCYDDYNKILRYIKTIGNKRVDEFKYPGDTYYMTIYELEFKEHFMCDRKDFTEELEVIKLRHNCDCRGIDAFIKRPQLSSVLKFDSFDWFGFYFFEKSSIAKILSEIETQFNVDKKKIFMEENE